MDDNRRNRLAAACLGALVFAFGAAVVAGWFLHLPWLFQIRTDLPPVQFNAAVGFGALGLGLVASAFQRKMAAGILALVPLVIGGVTVLTWVLDLTPGIDELLFEHYVTTLTLVPGRMPANNALSLFLCGGALLGSAVLPRAAVASAVWTLGLIMLFRGLVGSLWSVLDIVDVTPDYPGGTHMTVQVGICVVIAGVVLVLLTNKDRNAVPSGQRIWELPVLAGFSILMVSLLLWQALSVADKTRVQFATRDALSQVAQVLGEETRVIGDEVSRLARRTGRQSSVLLTKDWEADVKDYFDSHAWLREVVWVNPGGSIRSRVIRPPADPLPGIPAGSALLADANFVAALQTGTVQMLQSGGQGALMPGSVAYLVSGLESGGMQGALLVGARMDALLGEAIGQTARGYHIAISDEDGVFFSRDGEESRGSTKPAVQASVDVGLFGKRWVLQVTAGSGVASTAASSLPGIVFLFGAMLALMIAIALRYAAVVRSQSAGILEAGARLQREVDERGSLERSARSSEILAQDTLADMQQLLNQSPDLICIADREGCFVAVSHSSTSILGYSSQEMIGRNWREFVFADDLGKTVPEATAVQGGNVTRDFENRYVHRTGKLVHLSWIASWISGTGYIYGIARDVTAKNRQTAIREGHRQVLQLVAEGASLQKVLDAICMHFEMINKESVCSVLLVDADGLRLRSASAPSLPADYVSGVDGIEIGPRAASCGTAAWRKQLVVVDDIGTDPLWDSFRPLALQYGLRSCSSMPIRGEHGAILGTFAVYRCVPCAPESHVIDMVEVAARLASVAIERNDAHARLLESREQLEFARQIGQFGYWELSLDTDRVLLSADMLEQLGLPGGSGQYFNDLLGYVVEADRAILYAARDAAIHYDTPLDTEIRLQVPGGGLSYVHFRGRAVRHERGIAKLAGTIQNITARKLIELENGRLYAELESRVRFRTRELEQSNRELESFSYSVSHDLRAPLRAISGFGALLRDEYGSVVGIQGKHYLDRIIAGVGRMSALIDDLLELGRVGRIEITRQPLDLTALATQISGRLFERWPERRVDVEIQPDLSAWGDRQLMEVVMENLLENAWKFTEGREVGQIRIGTAIQHGEHAFFVADNGVGFDPQYAENLFGVFQRLHAASAFPGTGVGLATVQRILQRHGGRIWAEAAAERGATFYFTLS